VLALRTKATFSPRCGRTFRRRTVTCCWTKMHSLESWLVPIQFDKPEPGDGARRGPRRLWTVPLAPRVPSSGFEGLALLEELQGEVAGILFACFRDGLLWAATDPAARRELFGPRSREISRITEPSLSSAVEVFGKLVTGGVGGSELTRACADVAAWASTEGYPVTEYLFTVLAAYASPTDPYAAFAAGRAARRYRRIEDARTWFKRTIALARRADDEAASASAFLGWGILEERLGNREKAAAKFVKAWRAAKRGGLPELAGATRHNMIALALGERDFAAGNGHIVAAYKLYGRRNPQLYRLANDAAGFWSAFGYFSLSLPLFEAALPHVVRADERMAILANISRAAAGLGDRERYLEAWDQALELERAAGEALPEIYMELARGAHALGYHVRANDLATKARVTAESRRSENTIREAQSLLDDVAGRVSPDPPRIGDPPLERFAVRFSQRLRELGESA